MNPKQVVCAKTVHKPIFRFPSHSMPQPILALQRSFYLQPTEFVAQRLLGKALLRRVHKKLIVGGIIVETEAYLRQDDPACHAHRGITPRNRVMFEPGGTLYVYSIHAKYCMNVVAEEAGAGCAVLIRAIQPVWGIDDMQRSCGRLELHKLTNGPAKLCQAMGVTKAQNGIDLVQPESIWIAELDNPGCHAPSIGVSPRIGISQATELPLRFFIDRNRFVSGLQRDHSGPRNQQIEHHFADWI